MALSFENPKEYITELIGTMILVAIGCVFGLYGMFGNSLSAAIGFSLTFLGLIYCIGKYSSCHFNPLISLSMFINGKMKADDTLWYVLAQIIGGILGALFSLVLAAQIMHTSRDFTYVSYFGDKLVNNFGLMGIDLFGAILVEFLFAFVLCFVAMKATESKKIDMKSGAIIAAAMFGLIYIGCGMTGTAVNPAKSIGAAIAMMFSNIDGKFDPLIQLWLFIIIPLLGAVVGTFLYMILESDEFDLNKYLSAIKKKKSEDAADEEYAEESEEPVAEEEIVEEPVEEIPEIESVDDDVLPEVESEEETAEEVVVDSETKTE